MYKGPEAGESSANGEKEAARYGWKGTVIEDNERELDKRWCEKIRRDWIMKGRMNRDQRFGRWEIRRRQ